MATHSDIVGSAVLFTARSVLAKAMSRRTYETLEIVDGKGTLRVVDSSELPFVECSPQGQWRYWCVPEITGFSDPESDSADDYHDACKIGSYYAAHFVQQLKDNPGIAGQSCLADIAGAIDFADESAKKGYWVGFFSELERILYTGSLHVDAFDERAGGSAGI